MNKLLSFQHNENQTPFPKIVANNIHCQSVENETEPKVHFEDLGSKVELVIPKLSTQKGTPKSTQY